MNISEMFVAKTPELRKRLRYLERVLEAPIATMSVSAIATEIATIRMFLDSKSNTRKG
jgi:hypothetical protein